MLIDKSLMFASSEDLVGSAGTAKLGDAFNIGAAADQGVGNPLWLVAQIGNEALAGGTSVTLQLVTADNEALTTNPVVLSQSSAFVTAAGAVGASIWVTQLPSGSYKTWLGLRATEVGSFTGGTITAFLTPDPGLWRAYAEGMN